ncbi:MAG: hypothetical protein PHT97_11170 [Methanoculleus sp.]|jgi:uncharacterized membrane protein|nr:hypothetical protein [Methanoculleus sp.]
MRTDILKMFAPCIGSVLVLLAINFAVSGGNWILPVIAFAGAGITLVVMMALKSGTMKS